MYTAQTTNVKKSLRDRIYKKRFRKRRGLQGSIQQNLFKTEPFIYKKKTCHNHT